MLGYIKYRLLGWLLCDICEKSGCENCMMYNDDRVCDSHFIYQQARKVWGMGELE